jgi:anti-sigma regulatory factor (Ser/Thr protein kinase)
MGNGSPAIAAPGPGSASPLPWPLQTRLELAALPSAVSCARGHVRTVAREWGLAALADIAELLASEIATNAVQASQRLSTRADLAIVPVIRLWITSDGVALVIHVWDGNDEMPVRKEASFDAESGRGLLLVDSLGKEWGAYRKAEGKVVWVMITSADP